MPTADEFQDIRLVGEPTTRPAGPDKVHLIFELSASPSQRWGDLLRHEYENPGESALEDVDRPKDSLRQVSENTVTITHWAVDNLYDAVTRPLINAVARTNRRYRSEHKHEQAEKQAETERLRKSLGGPDAS